MTIPPGLEHFLTAYGYFAVFSLIFLQELGLPNPVANEIILLFAGYLSSTGALSFPLILLAGISADFIGTSILYAAFYFFGGKLLKRSPRWLPVERIESFKKRISKKGRWGIFLGRLIPYLRGYTSVAAGLLQIPPKEFLSSVFVSAVLWSGGYVIAGRLLGEEWKNFSSSVTPWELLLAIAGIFIIIFLIIPAIRKRFKNHVN